MKNAKENTLLLESQEKKKIDGLDFSSAVAYIVSTFGVAPLVALPAALEYCGILGFFIIPILLMLNAYTSIILVKSWLLLEDHWPRETSLNIKYPYPALGWRIGGPVLKRVINVFQNLAIFGEAVPFLLLASENFKSTLSGITNDKGFSFCYMLVVTALVLIPLLWIGSPRDLHFRHLTWIGAYVLCVMCFLVIYLLIQNAPADRIPSVAFTTSWTAYAYCFGAVAFQFGIHPTILTLQMDMENKSELPSAIKTSFAISCALYGIVAVVAFILYGDSLKPNILNNFSGSTVLYLTQGLVGIQSVICITLSLNTLFQDLEEKIGIPEVFGWRRVCLRTTIMLLVLFAAETVPHFAVAGEVVGGVLMTPLIFIFPPLIYNILKFQISEEINWKEALAGLFLMILGILGCIISTTASGIEISLLKEITPPCYVSYMSTA